MKVSVIIPCYNVGRYIEACVEALMNQTHQELEIIAIDDGSTDDTVARLEAILAKHPQILFKQQANAGGGAARNAGIDLATGDFIQFLDADDILAPEKIASQLAVAAQESADVVVGSYQRVRESGEVIFTRQYVPENLESQWLMLMKTNLGITSANLFKAEFFKNGGRWDETLKSSQEYDLMFRIMAAGGKVSFDPVIHTSIVERDGGSVSQVNRGDNWKRYIDLRVRIINHIKTFGDSVVLNAGYQVLFDAIRSLVTYDKQAAFSLYEKHIPKEFRPTVSPATGSAYIKLFKLFGFKGAERIKSIKG